MKEQGEDKRSPAAVSATDETVTALERTVTATGDTVIVPAGAVSASAATCVVANAPVRSGRAELDRGTKLGRYLVLDELGRGGLGIVVRAFDPDLERQVAIKLVRLEQSSERARERLLREAQAVAQLAHPNVVAVHDVGTVGDEVFVAMELVEGESLSAWLEAERSEADIVATFEQAAAGLMAAHDRGLIHRDFKPDNVLVGSDGRVRVVDFGLARALDTADLDGDESASSGPSTSLTHTGAVMGTPAYMAPEQHRGESVDARADQFAFCVSLYEAFAKTRPFAGDTYGDLATNVLAGARSRTQDARLPKQLAPIIDRGLALDPSARYESMTAVRDAIVATHARGNPRARFAAIGAVLAIGLALAVVFVRSPADTTCTGGKQAMTAVWNPDVRAKVRDRFEHSGVSYYGPILERVESDLDEYTRAWATMHREACEATRVAHAQSEQVLDLRTACLERRRAELKTLVSYLVEADTAVVDRASRATASMARIDECADVSHLLLVKSPNTPESRALAASLGAAKGHRIAGHFDEGEAIATAGVEQARAAGWVGLQADALFTRGAIRGYRQQPALAREDLRAAYFAAEEARSQVLKARIASELALSYVDEPGGHAVALDWVRHGRASLAAVGVYDAWSANLDGTEAQVLVRDGDPERALTLFTRALETKRRLYGRDNIDVAAALGNRSTALAQLGRYEESLADVREAMEVIDGVVGPSHPLSSQLRASHAHSLMDVGALSEAEALFRDSLASHENLFGESNTATLRVRVQLAMCLSRQNRQDDAVALLDETLELARASGQANTALYADALGALADAYQVMGNHAGALAKLIDARALNESIYGKDNPITMLSAVNLASQMVRLGTHRAALEILDDVVQRAESLLGTDHPLYARAQVTRSGAQILAGDLDDAVASLEAAIAFYQRRPGDGIDLAYAMYQLALVLWERPSERPRAVELVRQARDIFRVAAGGIAAANLAKAEEWLAAHSL